VSVIIKLWWREILIALLLGLCFFAVRACESAHEQVVKIKAEDAALASQAQHESDEKQANDEREKENAKRDFDEQIRKLADDHRVASVQCVRNPAGSSAVPATPVAAARAAAEVSPDVPQPSTFDPGPDIDKLTRECDALAVRHAALVDWLTATR
jgi:hypothetical protein